MFITVMYYVILRFVIYKLCMNKKLRAHSCARLITVPEWTTDAAIIHTSKDSYDA